MRVQTLRRRHLRGGLLLFILLAALGLSSGRVGAAIWDVDLAATVAPISVVAGHNVTYTLVLRNARDVAGLDTVIAHTLPAGFSYVSGSTRLYYNDALVSTANPSVTDRVLRWTGLTAPQARTASFYGMHTFVHDGWTKTIDQLDRVRALMGPGAYVKQLFYNITPATAGPEGPWVSFVNACYDRDLIPVVRLQGNYGGPNWIKPPASSPGDYTAIAAAYARVVAGLPRREGRPLYIEVWNEPNLDLEWSGAANPVEYGHFLVDVAAAIRALGDPRLVILNGGLSPTWGNGIYDRLGFIDAMAAVPGVMQSFDVWAVHPYTDNHPPEYNLHDGTAPDPLLAVDSYLLELERLANHGRKNVRVLITEAGYALGQNGFVYQGYPPINEANRADYIARALRDYWGQWPEVLGVCPYELVDPNGGWPTWDWVYPNGQRHQQYDAVLALNKTPPLARGELTLRFQARAAGVGACASAIEVTTSNLGSTALASVAPVQVIQPTPTATPTVTRTPTPGGTPTSTLTPSATPFCYPLLTNGGFEEQAAWDIPQTAYSAGYSSAVARSGQRSMRVGIVEGAPVYSYSGARQAVTLPSSATGAKLRLWYYPLSEDVTHGRQYVYLLDETQRYIEAVFQVASNARQWTWVDYDLSGHIGQTIWIHLGVRNDGEGGITGMYVDDVTVEVCGPQGFITPTPSATAAPPPNTPTPSATLTARPSVIFTPVAWTMLPLILKRNVMTGPSPHPVGEGGLYALSEVDRSLPQRPEGWASLARLSEGQDSAPIRALALLPSRNRLAVGMGEEVQVLDSISGRRLDAYHLPAAVGRLAYDETTGALCAALPERGELALLGSGGSTIQTIGDLGRPTNVVAEQGRLFVADSAEQRIIVVDGRNGSIIDRQVLGAAPYALALDTAGQRLYVSQMGQGAILVLDAQTLKPVGRVALGGMGYPLDLALDETAGRLYVAHALAPKYGALSVIDTRTLSLLTTLWGNPGQPLLGTDTVRVDPGRGLIWLGLAGGLAQLDTHDLAIKDIRGIPRSPWAGTMALDPDGSTLYVAQGIAEVASCRLSAPGVGHDYERD